MLTNKSPSKFVPKLFIKFDFNVLLYLLLKINEILVCKVFFKQQLFTLITQYTHTPHFRAFSQFGVGLHIPP